MTNLYIGVLSGTSMDAIDIAAIDFNQAQPKICATMSCALPPEYKQTYLQFINSGSCDLEELGQLDRFTGKLFATAILEFLDKHGISKNSVIAIGSHGQTIWHAPQAKHPFSLQLGDPSTIAYLTGITTIADFRSADIAAGGQGAPLAPAFHQAIFANDQEPRCIVNVGGFSNISVLANNEWLGFDSGPGNCLMDQWVKTHFGLDFDADGNLAAGGVVDKQLLDYLLDDPYFKRSSPKSTGREYFNSAWLQENLRNRGKTEISAVDVLTTLLHLTANSIAAAIKKYAPATSRIFLCGGGTNNIALVRQLSLNLDREIHTTTTLGIDPQWVETALFAWLAKQRFTEQPIDLLSITGSQRPVLLGGIYKV